MGLKLPPTLKTKFFLLEFKLNNTHFLSTKCIFIVWQIVTDNRYARFRKKSKPVPKTNVNSAFLMTKFTWIMLENYFYKFVFA